MRSRQHQRVCLMFSSLVFHTHFLTPRNPLFKNSMIFFFWKQCTFFTSLDCYYGCQILSDKFCSQSTREARAAGCTNLDHKFKICLVLIIYLQQTNVSIQKRLMNLGGCEGIKLHKTNTIFILENSTVIQIGSLQTY